MSIIPNVRAATLAKAKQVWNEAIEANGREVTLYDMEGTIALPIKAFVKRPKILGLFDRTEQSFDQERYMLLLKADDFTTAGKAPEKFMRATWDEQDHSFVSITEVDLQGVIFGYRILAKG
jgi:hypothetical protein